VPQYLGKLGACACSHAAIRDYAQTIYDYWVRRQLVVIADDVLQAAYDSPVDFKPREQIEEAEARLFALASSDPATNHTLLLAETIPITKPDDGPVAGLIWPQSTSVWYGPSGAGNAIRSSHNQRVASAHVGQTLRQLGPVSLQSAGFFLEDPVDVCRRGRKCPF
jgi:hypothetical protein